MKHYPLCLSALLLFLSGLLSACQSDDGAPAVPPPPVLSDLRCMGYQGQVRTVEICNTDEDFMELQASFDAGGRCLSWNVTGMDDPSAPLSGVRSVTSGWMSAPGCYRYQYDAGGRLVAVDCMDFGGETEHYTLRYGDHTGRFPLPFPVGSLYPYFAEGVTAVESEHYRFSYDGKEARAERQILSWMSLHEVTEFQLENGQVTEQTVRLYRQLPGSADEQIQRVRTFYEYWGPWPSRILEVAVDAEGNQEKVDQHFSTVFPYRLESRRHYVGLSAEPASETLYGYDRAGRLISVTDASGEAYFEEPYTWQYGATDAAGNWTVSTKTYAGDWSSSLTQTLTYW